MVREVGSVRKIEEERKIIIEWKIDDFLRLGSNETYFSPKFILPGALGCLLIHLRGQERGTPFEYAGICLLLRSMPEHCANATATFSLKTVDRGSYSEKTAIFHETGKKFYIHNFICRSDLMKRKSELLPSGALTAIFTLKDSGPNAVSADDVQISSVSTERQLLETAQLEEATGRMFLDASAQTEEATEHEVLDASAQTDKGTASYTDLPEEPGFATYYSHLFQNKIFTDVTFILETRNGEVQVLAHRLLLATRSPTFADQFYGNQRPKEDQIIRYRNISPKAFEDMIKYCYDCKPDLKTPEEAFELFKLSEDFQIVGLTNLCRTSLRDTEIEPKNVFIMLEVASYTEDQSLRDKCNKLIEEKTREVMDAYEIQDVTKSMVYAVIDLPKLSLCSEYELIKWLFDWGKVKAEEADSNCETSRQYLEKLLLDMNFLALTSEEFARLYTDYPDFFCCHELVSICLNIAKPKTLEMPDFYDEDVKIRAYTGSKQ